MSKYKDIKWLRKREAILRRDKYKCVECQRFGRTKPADTVHHVKPAEDFPEEFLNSNNLISLCGSCHNKMHVRGTHELTDTGKGWVVRIEREKKTT